MSGGIYEEDIMFTYMHMCTRTLGLPVHVRQIIFSLNKEYL